VLFKNVLKHLYRT